MAQAPTFHLYLPQMRMSHEDIVERAVGAEAAGFEGMAFMDHLAPPLALDQPMWEAMSIASWVLAKTTTLQVGHLVLCDSFRHPALLARQVTSLDHASGGRFELGLGWGSVPLELATYGVGSTENGPRLRRMEESLAILRGLWSGEAINHAGENFTLSGAQQVPVPTRRIPITVGGIGPRTLRLVREYADWCNIPIHSLGDALAVEGGIREQVGNARLSVQRMVALVTSEQERAEATALVNRRYAGTKILPNIVIGTPKELAEHFAGAHAAGIDRFYIWFTDFAQPATLARFGHVISATGRE